MFDEIMMEYEISVMKNDDMFESALDKCKLDIIQMAMLESTGYRSEDDENFYAEAGNEIVSKIKEWFDNIIKAIKKFIEDTTNAIEVEIANRNMRKKLKWVEEYLKSEYKKDAKLSNHKISIFDTANFVKAYKTYINEAVKVVKQTYGKTYNNIDEYSDAVIKGNKYLEDLYEKLNLSKEDVFMIDVNIVKAYEYSDKELANVKQIMNMLKEEYNKAIETYKDMAINEDDPSKVANIKAISSKESTRLTRALRKVSKSSVNNASKVISESGANTNQ